MVDQDVASVEAATKEVAKSRRGLMAAFLGTLLVVATIAGVLFITGIDPFAALEGVRGEDAPVSDVAPSDETTTTPASPSAELPLPPVEAQETMYWEQVWSREQIADLVGDKFAAFEFSQVAAGDDTADIRVKADYRDGTSMSGWLLMRQYDGMWYFAMITRDTHRAATPPKTPPDMDVARAIAGQQSANQDIPRAILNGGYTKVSLSRVTVGSGTAMIDATFSGGTLPETKGQITCIKKDIGGTSYWFITAFSRS